MGIRLDGPPLLSTKGHDILSEGVVPGSIQVPGDRQPIVLGRDCQTTGGYPKIATVISADFDRLAQCKVSQTLRFQAVTMEEALEAARRVDDWRRSLQRHLRPAGVVPLDLHAHNLIGGVTRGDD
jgi:allophanate hydrolase subunit 2